MSDRNDSLKPPKEKISRNYMRRSSFLAKQSHVNIGSDGEWKRPHLEVDKSKENLQINERLYKLMDEYIPKDKETIEKRYC